MHSLHTLEALGISSKGPLMDVQQTGIRFKQSRGLRTRAYHAHQDQ